MNEETIIGSNNKPTNEEPKPIRLSIEMTIKGEIKLEAPGNEEMYDEPICFWLLEKAKDFIKIRNGQATQSKILKPNRFMRRHPNR